jgi:hypothetical protein
MVICHFCKKKIIKGQRRVHYMEDIDDKIDFDISFHAKCWKQKWDLSVDTQCKILAKNMMANVLPKVKHIMESREVI